MQIDVSTESVGIALAVLGALVGWLGNTKATVIILRRDLRTAFKLHDKLLKRVENLEKASSSGSGPNGL